jgi:hypothetical protein
VRIEYVTTRHERDVSEGIGRRLVKSRIARKVCPPQVEPDHDEVTEPVAEVQGASRAGRRKRQYRRRDLRAED